MAILEIFKKKKEKKKEVKEAPQIEVAKIAEKKEEGAKPPTKMEAKRKREGRSPEIAYRILKAPQITEKATALTGKNQYTFKVWPGANKVEIEKAIEDLYGVEVISVKIIKVPRKRRRLGRIRGWRAGYKKAIVKIKEGQKIEVLPR